jgi:dUTP pyrophosphatase
MPVTISLERMLNSCATPFSWYHLTLRGLSSRITDMDISAQLLQIAIKRIETDLPLPTYATSGSVGFDLLCRKETEIAPRTVELIPGNVIVRIPAGYMLLLTMRSSTPLRKGLLIPNGVGVIDQDYCGEGDELKVQVFNFREEAVTVTRGERIAQGIFIPVMRILWDEVDEMGQARGGFGSTGV